MLPTKDEEEKLIVLHTPLVVSIAYKFKPQPPNDYDDLISVGKIGLLKAIRAYDPTRGTQFSTLASTVIRREIVRELEKTNNKGHESLNIDVEGQESKDFEDYLPVDLTESEHEILTLRLHDGFTFEEIGNKLGYTKQWANIKYKTALAKIIKSNEQKKKENTLSK